MARIWQGGAEVGHINAENAFSAAAVAPTVTGADAAPGGGSFAFQANSGAGNALSYGDATFTGATATDYYGKAKFKLVDLPTSSSVPVLAFLTSASVLIGSIRVTSAGVAQLWNETGTPAQVGSDLGTMSAGTWYTLGLHVKVATAGGAASTLEAKFDLGSTVGTTTANLGTTAPGRMRMGWGAAPGASKTIRFDDGVLNDGSGAALNTWPGDSYIVCLKPAADSARGSLWTGGAGGTTNLWDAVNDAPPTGLASASATNTSQIEHSGGTAQNYDANLQTYTAAGIGASDTINVVHPVMVHGEDIATGTKVLTMSVVSNPAIASAGNFNAGNDVGAVSTYPTNWATNYGTMTIQPSVTMGTAPVMRASRPSTDTRVASVAFMGLIVEASPPAPVAKSASDSGTLTATEGATKTVAVSTTDSGTLTATEAQSTTVQVTVADSATLTATEGTDNGQGGAAPTGNRAIVYFTELEVPDAGGGGTNEYWGFYTDATPDSSMTVIGANNTTPTLSGAQTMGSVIRLRVQLTTSVTALQVQYSVDGTNWADIPNADNTGVTNAQNKWFLWANGAGTAGGTLTQAKLGGTATLGKYIEARGQAATVSGGARTEFDLALKVRWPPPDTTIQLRLLDGSTPITLTGANTLQLTTCTAAQRSYTIAKADPAVGGGQNREVNHGPWPRVFWDGTYWWVQTIQPQTNDHAVVLYRWNGSAWTSYSQTFGTTSFASTSEADVKHNAAIYLGGANPVLYTAIWPSGAACTLGRFTLTSGTPSLTGSSQIQATRPGTHNHIAVDQGGYIWLVGLNGTSGLWAKRSTNPDSTALNAQLTVTETVTAGDIVKVLPIASDRVLVFWAHGTVIRACELTSAGWGTPVTATTTADINPGDWDASLIGTTVYLIHSDVNGTGGTWRTRLYNTSTNTWSAGTDPGAAQPTQNSNADGLVTVPDGTDLWVFGTTIGTEGGQDRTITAIKWNGSTWGSSTLITPAGGRGNGDDISGPTVSGNGQIPILYLFNDCDTTGMPYTYEWHVLTASTSASKSQSDSGTLTATDAASTTATISTTDSGTLTATESATTATTTSTSDSGTLTATEAASTTSTRSQADSATLTATEAATTTATASAADSGTLTATESPATTAATSTADSGTLTAAEGTSVSTISPISASDSGTLTATEAASTTSTRSQADSATLTAAEAQSIAVTTSTADSGTLTASEGAAVTVPIAQADSGTLTATEGRSTTATVASTDSGTLTATESAVPAVQVSAADSGTLTASESPTIASSGSVADSGTLTATEGTSVTTVSPVAQADSGTLTASETATMTAAVAQSDSATLTATEGRTTTATITVADSATLTASEGTSGGAPVASSDSGTLTATESTTTVAAVTVADSGTLTATEATAITVTTSTADSGTLTGSEGTAGGAPVAASDSGTLTATEGRTATAAITVADSATLTATEATQITAPVAASDSGTLTATETPATTAVITRSDSGTLTATEQADVGQTNTPINQGDSGTLTASEGVTTQATTQTADSGALTASEGLSTTSTRSVADSGTLTASEGTLVTRNVTVADSGTLTASELVPLAASIPRADAATLTATEGMGEVVTLTRADAGTLTATEDVTPRALMAVADAGLLTGSELVQVLSRGALEPVEWHATAASGTLAGTLTPGGMSATVTRSGLSGSIDEDGST